MDNITLFTIDCPACKVLEKKLNQKNIPYESCRDKRIFKEKGIETFPKLLVNHKMMSFGEAVKWLNTQE